MKRRSKREEDVRRNERTILLRGRSKRKREGPKRRQLVSLILLMENLKERVEVYHFLLPSSKGVKEEMSQMRFWRKRKKRPGGRGGVQRGQKEEAGVANAVRKGW